MMPGAHSKDFIVFIYIYLYKLKLTVLDNCYKHMQLWILTAVQLEE